MRIQVIATAFFVAISSSATAGVFGDDLSRCMVRNASEADKKIFMSWMFSAITADPSFSSMTTLTLSDRNRINVSMARIYDRLLLVDCRSEAIEAIKKEGVKVIGESGRALGGSAAQALLSSPAAEKELERFAEQIDTAGWEQLGVEAGVQKGTMAK